MVSSQFAWEKLDKNTPKKIIFSPIAAMGYAEWDIFLRDQFASHPKKLLANILSEKLPKRFVDGFISEFFSDIATIFPVSISKSSRENIAKLL
jgi:hypothetical protein